MGFLSPSRRTCGRRHEENCGYVYLILLSLCALELKIDLLISSHQFGRTNLHVFQLKQSELCPLMEEVEVILGFSFGKRHPVVPKYRPGGYSKDL